MIFCSFCTHSVTESEGTAVDMSANNRLAEPDALLSDQLAVSNTP